MPEEFVNPLLSLVKEQGLIDDLQFEEISAEYKRRGTAVVQILQDFGIMDLDTILHVIGNHMGTEVISLRDRDIGPDVLKTIPAKTARTYRCVPVSLSNSTIQVAFEDPLNPARVDELGFIIKKEIQPVIA